MSTIFYVHLKLPIKKKNTIPVQFFNYKATTSMATVISEDHNNELERMTDTATLTDRRWLRTVCKGLTWIVFKHLWERKIGTLHSRSLTLGFKK